MSERTGRHFGATLAIRVLVPALAVALLLGAGGEKPRPTGGDPGEPEAEALAFVREHHPELATVLEPLKARDPAEFAKAVGDLSAVARHLADLKVRNPKRHGLALDAWKAKSRVELLAAQLAGSPKDPEIRSRLRLAIEARIEADLARQKFELAQAEAAARRLRQSIDRVEQHKDDVVEARFRALLPKKPRAAKKPGLTKAAPAPALSTPARTEDRP